jgi:hypothetical protein
MACSGCVCWTVDGRERRFLRVRCDILEMLLCVELFPANVMPDHATFLNYVIPSQRIFWSRKPPDVKLGVCCVELRGCGSACLVIRISLKDLISGYDCQYTHTTSNNGPHCTTEDNSWTISLSPLVQLNI